MVNNSETLLNMYFNDREKFQSSVNATSQCGQPVRSALDST